MLTSFGLKTELFFDVEALRHQHRDSLVRPTNRLLVGWVHHVQSSNTRSQRSLDGRGMCGRNRCSGAHLRRFPADPDKSHGARHSASRADQPMLFPQCPGAWLGVFRRIAANRLRRLSWLALRTSRRKPHARLQRITPGPQSGQSPHFVTGAWAAKIRTIRISLRPW